MKIRLLTLTCVMLLSQPVWSMTLYETEKITAPDGLRGERFGRAVSVSGDTAIIGIPYDKDSVIGPTTAGAAYVFIRSGEIWEMQAKLVPPAEYADLNDYFGLSVAIDGDTAVIGAPYDDGESNENTASGAVYIFTRSGTSWNLQTMIYDPKPGSVEDPNAKYYDLFGYSVSISGDNVLIGAPKLTPPFASPPAAAYFYTRSGTEWTLSSEFTDLPLTSGYSVSISGNTAVIGAYADNEYGSVAGSAIVYSMSGNEWFFQAKLSASDQAAGDGLGGSVSIDQDTIIVGAHGNDDLGENSGSAYVFTRSGANWTEQAKLLPSDGAANDIFGRSVAVSGDMAVVSNNPDLNCLPDNPITCENIDPGSAYVYERKGLAWQEKTILAASDGEAGDQFGGYNLSLSGDTVIVGAPEEDEKGTNAGSAYVFELDTETDTVNDSSDDAGISAIEVTAVTFQQNEAFECDFDVASASTGLLDNSSFACYLDFDNEESETDRICDANGDYILDGSFRLGTNDTCDTSDFGLHYRVGKTGGNCTGVPSVECSEMEFNGLDQTDEVCDGEVEGQVAVSCRVLITADPEEIADIRDSLCEPDECLTNKDEGGNFEAYLWATSKLRNHRDRIPDTDDNDKPNSVDEAVRRVLTDPSL